MDFISFMGAYHSFTGSVLQNGCDGALRDLSLKQAREYATQVYSFWHVLYYEKILTYKDKLSLRMLNEKNEELLSFQTFL
ncbi:hypothetical protein [Bartonella sp. AC70YNML]|uniref:hypothetical protein n=1 Tax=Bartonella sp. AC70YNML TaxID=3243460 RepID=UPI0035CF1ABB